jgi:hypothetical protein
MEFNKKESKMRITRFKQAINQETFAPSIKVELEVDLELLIDGEAELTEAELYEKIGRIFVTELKTAIDKENENE